MAVVRIALSLLVSSNAARFTRKADQGRANSQAESRVLGAPGLVHSVYNWGSPGSASPGLQNPMGSSPCFPGMRTWHQRAADTDMVTWALNIVNFWHPVMKAQAIKIEDLSDTFTYPCTEETTHLPPGGGDNFDIHSPLLYDVTAEMKYKDQRLRDISWFGVNTSYEMNSTKAAVDVKKARGWNLVGTSHEDGSTSHIEGPQVTHLLQEPNTLECVLTFMGTGSIDDWLGNAAVAKEPFCGLSLPGEKCGLTPGLCKTEKPRGSFAHMGFAQKLRKLVATDDWEHNIRSKFGSCSKLVVVGQSAGASMAELFQACVANAPAKGDFGYDDYERMGWTNGQVKQMAEYQ